MKLPKLIDLFGVPQDPTSGIENTLGVPQIQIPGGLGFFVDLANLAWDLRRSTADVRTAEIKPDMKKVARHVDRLWEFLEHSGLKIQDHINQPFDSGHSLQVIAFQPSSGVEREIVIETVRPTVYFQDIRIQKGQVIVGTPQITAEEMTHDTDHN